MGLATRVETHERGDVFRPALARGLEILTTLRALPNSEIEVDNVAGFVPFAPLDVTEVLVFYDYVTV